MEIVHNEDYYYPKKQYYLKCLKYNKDAEITIIYHSVQMCKTDIQLTPVESGRKCSLWDENNLICPECPYLKK